MMTEWRIQILCGVAVATLAVACQPDQVGTTSAQGAAEAPKARAPQRLKRADALLTVGTQVPPFEALSHIGARVAPATFAHRPWVVVFPQGELVAVSLALRDAWLPINERLDAALVFSPEDTATLRGIVAEHALPVLLVADPKGEIQAAFGVTAESAIVSFVLSPKGQITHVISEASPQALADRVAAAVGQ